MLVLSRKVGERILIGENISVTVVRVSGGGVRLGIEAPSSMPVVREELQQDLAPNDAAVTSNDTPVSELKTNTAGLPESETKPALEGEQDARHFSTPLDSPREDHPRPKKPR